MKTHDFSIITVTLNSQKTLKSCLQSVQKQRGVSVQHIVKDGQSKDTTREIALSFKDVSFYAEKDIGIYNAMNQGFVRATGEIIGFLNSDDYYSDEKFLSKIKNKFSYEGADIVCAGITYIHPETAKLKPWRVGQKVAKWGIKQYPHPGVFIKKTLLEKLDTPFDIKYKISSDYKQQLILLSKPDVKVVLLDEISIHMRLGGASNKSLKAKVLGIWECCLGQIDINGPLFAPLAILKVFLK